MGDHTSLDSVDEKAEHSNLKDELQTKEYREQRQRARKALWDLRSDQPGIEGLFRLEAKPPIDDQPMGSVVELWEPPTVY